MQCCGVLRQTVYMVNQECTNLPKLTKILGATSKFRPVNPRSKNLVAKVNRRVEILNTLFTEASQLLQRTDLTEHLHRFIRYPSPV
jgi:hypothetical protein